MATTTKGTTGIYLEDCDGVEMTDNKFIGLDRAVHAVRSTNIRSNSNVIISREFTDALSSSDKAVLVHAFGLPVDTPATLVGEALNDFSNHHANPDQALRELKDSRLARNLGAAADLSALSQTFLQVIQSGALATVLARLFS